MKVLRNLLLAAVVAPAVLVLAGCETAPRRQGLPEIHFTHMAPISLDVASVEVVQHYAPPFTKPNVDHLFTTSPRDVMERWANDRLRAVGTGGRARFIVLDASVVESKLATTQGLAGIVKKEESERYDGSVEARLEVYDAAGSRMFFASARATQFQTVLEDASPNERRKAWFDLLSAMMKTFDQEMDRAIRSQLPGVVR